MLWLDDQEYQFEFELGKQVGSKLFGVPFKLQSGQEVCAQSFGSRLDTLCYINAIHSSSNL